MRRGGSEEVETVKGLRQRRLHKAFLRYHDAENWPLLREALKAMGRADLIGPGKHHLVPTWQPAGTGLGGGEGKRLGKKHGTRPSRRRACRSKATAAIDRRPRASRGARANSSSDAVSSRAL